MKKLTALLICVAMATGLAACNSDENSVNREEPPPRTEKSDETTTTPPETTTPPTEKETLPTETDDDATSDYGGDDDGDDDTVDGDGDSGSLAPDETKSISTDYYSVVITGECTYELTNSMGMDILMAIYGENAVFMVMTLPFDVNTLLEGSGVSEGDFLQMMADEMAAGNFGDDAVLVSGEFVQIDGRDAYKGYFATNQMGVDVSVIMYIFFDDKNMHMIALSDLNGDYEGLLNDTMQTFKLKG
ncbi:MAG: hypothetical protein LBI38_04405 [Oscillospiraceae bacterium]|jgi:hypothetical protein|nr:hypothetical protein [Oscillospiraceae bacterium]